MERSKRATDGYLIYHVWNKGNVRMTTFVEEGDCESF